MSNYPNAIRCFHLALKSSPDDALIYYNLAMSYEKQGETNEDKSDI